jgi:hypothetical protein
MLLACAFIDNPKLLELNLTRGYASVDPHDGRSYFIPDKMSNHYFFSRVHISDYYGYLFQTTI